MTRQVFVEMTIKELRAGVQLREEWIGKNFDSYKGHQSLEDARKYNSYVTDIEDMKAEIRRRKDK